MQHRRQGLAQPTLIVNFELDSAMEKLRKRRSSRAGSLSVAPSSIDTLFLRNVPDDPFNIYHWQACIEKQLRPKTSEELPMSPMSPMSPVSPTFTAFTNPFASSRPTTASTRPEISQRIPSITQISTQVSRDHASALISPSPSLRSRRSDLSSQASSHPSHHPAYTYAHPFSPTLPNDLPSPVSAYDAPFIEGWTAAQGRSPTLSSHTRGSNSVASTPSIPRETILDRAFQMRCIPGSERLADSEEQSSTARFEALMREIDERKSKGKSVPVRPTIKTDLGLGEHSDESDYNDDIAEEDEDYPMQMSTVDITAPAQRALEYISGRTTPMGRSLSPIPQRDQIPTIPSIASMRPRSRASRPQSIAIHTRLNGPPSMTSPSIVTENEPAPSTREKRTSSTSTSASTKHLSFTEFTRQLSSTSSLLIVQTNASLSSSSGSVRRGSSELSFNDENDAAGPSSRGLRHSSMSARDGGGGNALSLRERETKRCGWRGSVGVFGGEGGFM
jgi:hypothetical protein